MPRIDPAQLLRCLSVLLSKNGGIVSKGEVNRVANLMEKFSKKLVSKCIYVSILKATEIDILDMFMSAGGWDLIFSWLSDGITAMNWAFVEELVELLLMCPVNIDRLKGNNCPKVIKLLSKNTAATERVRELAEIVVEQWLAMVKEATSLPGAASVAQDSISPATQVAKKDEESENNAEDSSSVYKITIKDGPQVVAQVISSDKTEPRVDTANAAPGDITEEPTTEPEISGTKRPASSEEDDEEDFSPRKKSSTALRESSDDSETSDEEWKVKKKKAPGRKRAAPKAAAEKKTPIAAKKRKQKPEKAPVEKPEKTSKKKEEKVVELIHPPCAKPLKKSVVNKLSLKSFKEEEKEKISAVNKLLLKSLKEEEKEKTAADEYADKDRQTLAKLVTPSLSGMGRIPKKHKDGDEKKDEKKEEKKVLKKVEVPPKPPPKPAPKNPSKYNYTPSVGKRDVIDRPKTVKTFNAKFRSTGLEEEPPPPPKAAKKPEKKEEIKEIKPIKTHSPPPSSSPTSKKHSEVSLSPPKIVVKEEDKSHDKASAASKPKTMHLQESNMFGDALAAAYVPSSAKKKKRRTSTSEVKKEPETTFKPLPEIKEHKKEEKEPAKPKLMKFYQDTLITDEDDTPPEVKKEKEEDDSSCPVSQSEIEDELSKTEEAISNFVKQEERKNFEREKFRLPQGILVYYKKKKIIKKTVVWRPGESIQEVRYFELDETERVNVTKNFSDMKLLEKANERENLLHSRRIASHDIMEEKTRWTHLVSIDVPTQEFNIEPGKNSHERESQAQRERTVVPALYFHKKMIPDSPAEPDLEIHAHTEPVAIPLNDMTLNPESVISYKDKGWPEPQEAPPEPILETPELMAAPSMPPEMMMNGPPPGLQMPPGQFPYAMPPAFFPPAGMPPMMGPGGWGVGMPAGDAPQPLFNGPPQDLMSMGGPPLMDTMPFLPNMGGPGMGPPMGPGSGPGPNINQGFMGEPQGPPMNYNNQPNHFNDGPGPRPSRPWFRGHNGPNNWRHPNKGGAPWKSSKKCINIIKRGFCKTPHCPFMHPPPNTTYS